MPLAVLIPNTLALWNKGFPQQKAERDTKADPVHHASVVEMRLFPISVNIYPLHTHAHCVHVRERECVCEVLQQPCEAEDVQHYSRPLSKLGTEEGPEHREQWTKAGMQLRAWNAMHSKL